MLALAVVYYTSCLFEEKEKFAAVRQCAYARSSVSTKRERQENANYHCLKLTLVALMKLPRNNGDVVRIHSFTGVR